MKRIIIPFTLLFAILFSFSFVVVQAQTNTKLSYAGGLVQCDGVVTPGETNRNVKCDFAALINTIKSIVNWLFFITIPVATVLFAYAGLLYLTGQEAKIKKAKEIFTSVAIGFIIMLTGWFIVSTLLKWFADSNSGATTFIGK